MGLKSEIKNIGMMIGIIFFLSGCAANKEKLQEVACSKGWADVVIKNQEVLKGEIPYNEKESFDVTDFEEFYKVEKDINNDGDNEIILLLGKGEKFMLDEAYVVICDSISQNVLTYFEVGTMAASIGDIGDATGDNVCDILIENSNADISCDRSLLYIYDNGEYKEALMPEMKLVTNFIVDFRYEVKEEYLNKRFVVELSEVQKQNYITFGMYDKDGNLGGTQLGEWFRPTSGNLIDIDNDNIYEFLSSGYMVGMGNAESVTSVVGIYKFIDGKFELIDLNGEAEVIGLPEKYKKNNS